MSDLLREQLSAFMDGELPSEECTLLLKRVTANAELKERWSTWHLIGDSLRGDVTVEQSQSLAQRVELALDAETKQSAAARTRPNHWLMRRSATIAAAVAVIGVAGLIGALVSRQVGPGQVLVPGAGNGAAVSAPAQQVNWRNAPQPVRAELNSYLLMHELYGARPMVVAKPEARKAAPALSAHLTTGTDGS